MFGMSLGEILVIAIIAILFVGPEKLPDALVKIAKFFRSFKNTVAEAKESFDRELQIKELKEEALSYKRQLQATVEDVKDESGLDKLDQIYEEFNSINHSIYEEEDEEIKEPPKKKKKKKKKKSKENINKNEENLKKIEDKDV